MKLNKRLEVLQFFSKHQIEPKSLAFGESTLQDGTPIYYEGDTPEVGAAVFVVDPNGQYVAAPEGDHTLSDGTVISVAQAEEQGVMIARITAVTPAAAEEAPAENPSPEAQAEEGDSRDAKRVIRSIIEELQFSDEASDEEVIEQAKNYIVNLQAELNEAKEKNGKFSKQVENAEKENEVLVEALEKFKSEPATEPAHQASKLRQFGSNSEVNRGMLTRIRKVTN